MFGYELINVINLFSIGIYFLIIILSIIFAISTKRYYGFGFSFSFALYIIKDIIELFIIPVSPLIINIIFFIATFILFITLIYTFNDIKKPSFHSKNLVRTESLKLKSLKESKNKNKLKIKNNSKIKTNFFKIKNKSKKK